MTGRRFEPGGAFYGTRPADDPGRDRGAAARAAIAAAEPAGYVVPADQDGGELGPCSECGRRGAYRLTPVGPVLCRVCGGL